MKRIIYATTLKKGHEHLAIVRRQMELQRAEHFTPKSVKSIDAAEHDGIAFLVEQIGTFYHSDYVKHNMSYLLKIPFEEYLQRRLRKLGHVL